MPDYCSGNYDSDIVDGITDEVDKNTHHAEIVSASLCFSDLVTMVSMRMLAQENVSYVMIQMLPVWVYSRLVRATSHLLQYPVLQPVVLAEFHGLGCGRDRDRALQVIEV